MKNLKEWKEKEKEIRGMNVDSRSNIWYYAAAATTAIAGILHLMLVPDVM